MNDYEIINNMTKNKYEDIIKNKDNEIKELKGNILSYKIEKDKYLYDYNLIQSEYDKLFEELKLKKFLWFENCDKIILYYINYNNNFYE